MAIGGKHALSDHKLRALLTLTITYNFNDRPRINVMRVDEINFPTSNIVSVGR